MVRNIIKTRWTGLAKDNHALIKVTSKGELCWNILNLSNFSVQGKTFYYTSRALHFFLSQNVFVQIGLYCFLKPFPTPVKVQSQRDILVLGR